MCVRERERVKLRGNGHAIALSVEQRNYAVSADPPTLVRGTSLLRARVIHVL